MRSSSADQSRTRFIIGLLMATLILAGVLGLQAAAGVRYHRATAEGVLRDYARAAAEEYANRAARELEYYGFYPTFRVLRREHITGGASRVPDPAALAGADEMERRALKFVRATFRFDVPAGHLVMVGDTGAAPGWLRDTLPAHLTQLDPEWRSAVLVSRSAPRRVAVYTVERDVDASPQVAYGVLLDSDSVQALLAASAGRAPLLPPTLTRRTDPDSLMAVTLEDAGGAPLYRNRVAGAEYSPFVATAALGPRFGGLRTQVALHPDLAAQLIIGGLPRGRLPVIAGLLLLTLGLILAALTLLRREQELARLRTEFVSNVSHELRTPLAEIRMFAETLVLDRVRSLEERRRSLAIIDQEARRLTQLVENVLYLSRADRDAARVSPEPLFVAPLVADVAEVYAPLASARQVQLRTDAAAHATALADRTAMQQILLNLLDNAVKYGPDGQTVTLGAAQTNGAVRLWVEDQGPGIPAADHERIWQRFSRLDRERESTVAGTGIGLAVVRELVELQGGKAWSEAGPDGGARFIVEVPAANQEHTP